MMESLTRTAEASLSDNYIQPTLGHALRIWWAFYWPTTLISTVLGFGFGRLLRLAYEDGFATARIVRVTSQVGGYAINYVVALFVMHYVLSKNFRHFRLGLLSSGGGGTPNLAVDVTYRRTLRVWWIYVWRTIVYTVLASVFVIYPAGMFVGLFRPSAPFSYVFFALLGFVVSGALALFVIYSNILEEDIDDFRVSLLPRELGNKPAPATPASDAAPEMG
jgi:hypothetical protein